MAPRHSYDTERINAWVVLESAAESREMKLLEVLRVHVDDADLFERLSAMEIGETVSTPRGEVRRLR